MPSTFTVRSRSRSRASGTWATLFITTSMPVDRAADDGHVAHVAPHELDLGRSVGGVVQVEHADPVTGLQQTLHEQRAEVAAAAGDEVVVTVDPVHRCDAVHSSMPWSRHQRMLRRIPSYSSNSGS